VGSVLFDFLNDSFLLDPTLIQESFSSVSDTELSQALAQYRAHCLEKWDALVAETREEPGTLRMFSGASRSSIALLKQAAFYLDLVILPDPLFPFSEVESELRQAISQHRRKRGADALDRQGIAAAAKLLLSARPMVAAGYAKFLPTSYFAESPQEVPIRYSPSAFSELLSPRIGERYRQMAKVTSLRREGDSWLMLPTLERGRGIAIEFEGDSRYAKWAYELFAPTLMEADEATRMVKFQMRLPDEPPSQEEFDAWVVQSVNQAAAHHFDTLARDIRVASACHSMYLTDSEFSAGLLDSTAMRVEASARSELRATSAQFLLNLEVPYFQQVGIEELMAARADSDAFDLFRRELEKHFRELRLESDPKKLEIKLHNAVHELTEVQLTKVSQGMARLKERLASDAVIAAAGLVGSFATSGVSLLGTLLAAAHGRKAYSDYQKSARENPAYFLWKASRR
jgi:hypothetical protein